MCVVWLLFSVFSQKIMRCSHNIISHALRRTFCHVLFTWQQKYGCFLKWWVFPHFTHQVLIILVGNPMGLLGKPTILGSTPISSFADHQKTPLTSLTSRHLRREIDESHLHSLQLSMRWNLANFILRGWRKMGYMEMEGLLEYILGLRLGDSHWDNWGIEIGGRFCFILSWCFLCFCSCFVYCLGGMEVCDFF